jgi:hypothetical protein
MPRHELDPARNTSEAIDYIFAGLKFFLMKHPKKTIPILIILFGFLGYVARDYIVSQRVEVMEAKPVGATLSLIPEAIAQSKTNAIMHNNQYFGEIDTNYLIYAIKGEQKLFVLDKRSNSAIFVRATFLDEDVIKQFKK